MESVKIYSFRARIMMVLVLTLIVSTVVLYGLSQRAEVRILSEIEKQRLDLTKAINVAQKSLTSSNYIHEFRKQEQERDDDPDSSVKRILLVDSQSRIEDSSEEKDIGNQFDSLGYGSLDQALNLDNITSSKPYKIYSFRLQARSSSDVDGGTGNYYILIIFSEELGQELRASSFNRVMVTSSVLLISLFVSLFLIIQFTKPVGALVEAAQRVAEGDYNFALQAKRRDEFGHLMTVFNNMVIGLKERRELEEKLSRAEQSAIVGRLASGIAHEVKNPLNYISLTIDYLRSKYAPAEEVAREKFFDKMDSIKDEIKRLDRLIRNFLSYGRPLNLNFKPLPLREMMSGILGLASEQAEQQSIKLILDQQTVIPEIEADLERLRSCFSNLVLNAQQAMPPDGGEISIDFHPQEEGIEVVVADTGTGIEPESLEKIFEPYFSTKETGTGLGLALVKRIIESHGGQIRVESVLGKGTSFYVWLPYHPPKISETQYVPSINSLPYQQHGTV